MYRLFDDFDDFRSSHVLQPAFPWNWKQRQQTYCHRPAQNVHSQWKSWPQDGLQGLRKTLQISKTNWHLESPQYPHLPSEALQIFGLEGNQDQNESRLSYHESRHLRICHRLLESQTDLPPVRRLRRLSITQLHVGDINDGHYLTFTYHQGVK